VSVFGRGLLRGRRLRFGARERWEGGEDDAKRGEKSACSLDVEGVGSDARGDLDGEEAGRFAVGELGEFKA